MAANDSPSPDPLAGVIRREVLLALAAGRRVRYGVVRLAVECHAREVYAGVMAELVGRGVAHATWPGGAMYRTKFPEFAYRLWEAERRAEGGGM